MGRNDGTRDIESAIQALAERLPASLSPLARITYDYAWSWTPGGHALFREMSPELWKRGGCNPRYLIEALPRARLEELAADSGYLARVHDVAESIARRPASVASGPLSSDHPVAYFCSEFGLHCSLPIYGGGLGILAGDVLKTASDVGLPLVGIGLLYREGYFQQRLDIDGWQHEYWVPTDFSRLPLVRVCNPEGVPLAVTVEISGRTVSVVPWRVNVGNVPLYLLDTDLDSNEPADRWITSRLYIGDPRIRLAQYLILGVGGVRALAAMGWTPAVCHLNEGHAAFGSFERLRERITAGDSVETALEAVRAQTIFTTHTPVEAGNESYSAEDLRPLLAPWEPVLPPEHLYGLGRIESGNANERVIMTALAIRTSRRSNAVSRRHGEVAREMWAKLWPGRAASDVPIDHVTNGVHARSWMAEPMQALLDRHLGPEWRDRLGDDSFWSAIEFLPDEELWAVRCELRSRLVRMAREKSVYARLSREESPDYVGAAARIFDPHALTLGFARRVATYKRLYLLTHRLERGLRLISDVARPVQLVIAGKAHPKDLEAKGTLRRVFSTRHAPGVAERIVFLENYDLHVAPTLVAGVDLWLNLPRPPLEASGTSGMKVIGNGGLHLSVLDGWWPEGYEETNGWAIESPSADPDAQDAHDADALYDLLEREVVPCFYDRENGIPRAWIRRMKQSMRSLIPRFSSERMLREYLTKLYDGSTESRHG